MNVYLSNMRDLLYPHLSINPAVGHDVYASTELAVFREYLPF